MILLTGKLQMELFKPAVLSMLLRGCQLTVVLLLAAIAIASCCVGQGDNEGMMARRRDGSMRLREELVGRSSFLLLLPASARCCVVEATMRA